MANKFQKSVQERIEQEAKLQKRIESKKERGIVTEKPKEEPQPVTIAEKPFTAETVTKEMPLKEISTDISAYLRHESERQAKNKTFYLDVQVIEALHRAATAQRVTDSKLCNDILRSVLSLD